ncbi:MAG: hypothetical protein KF845_01835 [Cyclobacteriaceae bacterium]|nr:hypothetical protein [Cyclobacteriaceae bacterium]
MESPVNKTQVKRNRATAITFALLTIVSLLFLVYAFIQKSNAEQQMLKAEEYRVLYEEAMEQLNMERLRAEESRSQAEAALVEHQRMMVEEAMKKKTVK